MARSCECPEFNPDCQHPTCPRYPQPGHLELEGATRPPEPNMMVATPGEFAALWNSWPEEQRQGFLYAMRAADDAAVRCRMAHGPRQHDGIAGMLRDAQATPADQLERLVADDPGRC